MPVQKQRQEFGVGIRQRKNPSASQKKPATPPASGKRSPKMGRGFPGGKTTAAKGKAAISDLKKRAAAADAKKKVAGLKERADADAKGKAAISDIKKRGADAKRKARASSMKKRLRGTAKKRMAAAGAKMRTRMKRAK